MSLKGQHTKSDYINFDTATNKAKKLLNTKDKILGLYVIVSINSGLRCQDVLCLTWEQLRTDKIDIIEIKTGKNRTIKINDNIKNAINSFSENLKGHIFVSQKKSIFTIQQINRKLKVLFSNENKTLNISTHSLRKTFGRRVYENNNESEKALIYLNELFNHSTLSTTRIYLGIRQEELDNIYLSL